MHALAAAVTVESSELAMAQLESNQFRLYNKIVVVQIMNPIELVAHFQIL